MSSERWGGFSVRDHIDAAALAADVLLYDRLLLPVPPDNAEEERWKEQKWEPELQKRRLDVLGDLAERIPWNDDRQQMYQAEMERLRGQGLKVNGFQLTGMMLARERGVDVVGAYHSAYAFQKDYCAENDLNKEAYLAYLLGARFAVPKGDPIAGVALGLAAAPTSPLAVGGALLTMVQFSKMDTKPAVYAGPYGPAAMFHEFENIEKPFWDWTKHA